MIEHATGQTLVRMELKYCEGCGGLLLRRSGDNIVYCAGCQSKLAELPQATPDAAPSNSPAPMVESAATDRAGNAVIRDAAPASVAGSAPVARTTRPRRSGSRVTEPHGAESDVPVSASAPKLQPRRAICADVQAEQRRMA